MAPAKRATQDSLPGRAARIRPADELHVYALGEGAVLFAALSQELHILNPAAAFLWTVLDAGASTDALAKALAQRFELDPAEALGWVEEQLVDWRSRGWTIEATVRRRRGRTAREGRSRRGRHDLRFASGPSTPRSGRIYHYRLLTTHFALGVPAGPVDTRIERVLAHLECDATAPADVIFELEPDERGYRLLENGRPVHSGLEATSIAPIIKLQMRNAAMNRHRYFMQIHAGAVLADAGVLLFPGMSGSGKTTLTASLVAAGFGYLTDEVALLERNSLAIRPFPLALTVKSGAVAPLAELYPKLPSLDVHDREDGKRVRYLRPSTAAIAPDCENGYPVRALIFPRYAPDASPSLQPVERCEALQRLMGSCLSLPEWLSAESVGNLVQWIGELDCWELSMRTVPDAVAMVRQGLKAA